MQKFISPRRSAAQWHMHICNVNTVKQFFYEFNFRSKETTAPVNHEGARAYFLTPEMELYAAIATTMLNDTFYEKADDRLARIKNLLTQVNASFIAKLAVYTRQEMNLRTAPVVLTTELAKIYKGMTW